MKAPLLISILLLIFNTAYAIEEGKARLMHGSSDMMVHEENPLSIEIISDPYEGCFVIGTIYPYHSRGYIKDAKISCVFDKNHPFEKKMKNIIISDTNGSPGIPMIHKNLPEDIKKQYKFYCESVHNQEACKAYISSSFGLFQAPKDTLIQMYWEIIE